MIDFDATPLTALPTVSSLENGASFYVVTGGLSRKITYGALTALVESAVGGYKWLLNDVSDLATQSIQAADIGKLAYISNLHTSLTLISFDPPVWLPSMPIIESIDAGVAGGGNPFIQINYSNGTHYQAYITGAVDPAGSAATALATAAGYTDSQLGEHSANPDAHGYRSYIDSQIAAVSGGVRNWETVLDIAIENTNGSILFTDGTGRHSVTAIGAAITSSAQHAVGSTASLYVNQDGVLTVTQHTDFDFYSRDFSITFDMFPLSVNNDYAFMKTAGNDFGLCLRLHWDNGATTNISVQAMDALGVINCSLPTLINKWSKIEVRRDGYIWYLLVDDMIVGAAGVYHEQTAGTSRHAGMNGFVVGGVFGGTGRFSGYIDNFKVRTRNVFD